MKKTITAIACTLLFFSCTKDDDNSQQTPVAVMRYQQTYCADKWGGSQLTDSATLSELRRYLSSQGLYHTQESIVMEGGPDLCAACQCHTGKMIYVRTAPNQVQAYLNLGFLR